MCGDKEIVSNILEEHKHSIKYGNNTHMFVVEKGSVRLVINDITFLI